MDTVTLVENHVKDGERLLDRLAENGIEVASAAWLKPSEDERWGLIIVTPLVDRHGVREAYGEVYSALRSLENIWITDSDIKLIGEQSPIAKDLAKAMAGPYRLPMILRRHLLGGLPVHEVYLYALPGITLKGFDKLKSQFPSAELFAVKTKGCGPGMDAIKNNPIVLPLIGKVNDAEFEGREPTTLLFFGERMGSASPHGWLIFVYRPEGWNKLFRPDTKTWEEVRFIGSERPIYESADFSPLAGLKAIEQITNK